MLTSIKQQPSLWRKFAKIVLPALMLAYTPSAFAGEIVTQIDASTVSKSRATPLGLYLTPAEAHQALTDNPDILYVDVRDPIEINFIGHAAGMDKNIPTKLASTQLDAKKGAYKMMVNPNFVAEMNALVKSKGLSKADPIFVSCRSGPRSAAATRLLAAEGYTNVWNLVEGFEGGKTKEGVRAKNGWRNAGLPWNYKLTPETAWTPMAK
jgi:rhodanese-related sulfurtransferase